MRAESKTEKEAPAGLPFSPGGDPSPRTAPREGETPSGPGSHLLLSKGHVGSALGHVSGPWDLQQNLVILLRRSQGSVCSQRKPGPKLSPALRPRAPALTGGSASPGTSLRPPACNPAAQRGHLSEGRSVPEKDGPAFLSLRTPSLLCLPSA